jgi:hypothetical protein
LEVDTTVTEAVLETTTEEVDEADTVALTEIRVVGTTN